MGKERWLGIPGSPGYQVSDLGRVRSVDRVVKTVRGSRKYKGKLLSLSLDVKGYLRVHLGYNKGVRPHAVWVHLLVALSFLGPRPRNHDVRHLDGDASNAKLTNLRYGSRRQNEIDKFHHGRHMFTRKDIIRIRSGNETGVNLAKEYQCSTSAIYGVKNMRNYSYVE